MGGIVLELMMYLTGLVIPILCVLVLQWLLLVAIFSPLVWQVADTEA